MGRKTFFILFFLVVTFYFLLTNFLNSFLIVYPLSKTENSVGKVNIGASVSVSVGRNKWHSNNLFWKIKEKEGYSKIYFFNFFPLPLKSNGFSFLKTHIVFFTSSTLIFTIFMILKQEEFEEDLYF